MPQDPPRSLCLRHSTFAPAARTVHVRQLNHCIRYFQMLRKTLMSYRQGNPLTFQWKRIYDGRRKRIRLRTAGVIQASVSVFFTNKLLVPCVCSDASYVCLTWLAWLAYCASPCSNAQWKLSLADMYSSTYGRLHKALFQLHPRKRTIPVGGRGHYEGLRLSFSFVYKLPLL